MCSAAGFAPRGRRAAGAPTPSPTCSPCTSPTSPPARASASAAPTGEPTHLCHGGCATRHPAPSAGMGMPAPGSTLRCCGCRMWVWGTQLSPSLPCRTIYRVAYRQRYRQLPEPTASCCPGWSRANGYRLGCNRGKELLGHPGATAHPQNPSCPWRGPKDHISHLPTLCLSDGFSLN